MIFQSLVKIYLVFSTLKDHISPWAKNKKIGGTVFVARNMMNKCAKFHEDIPSPPILCTTISTKTRVQTF